MSICIKLSLNSVWQKSRPNAIIARRTNQTLSCTLTLSYLSFYGEEKQLEPQRFMGSAVRTIIDNPFLTPHMIQETMSQSDYNFLLDSTLDQQVDKISVVPTDLSKEELAKIWSLYFQPPYVLSFAISASAILIKGNKSGGRALPVRKIATYSTPNSPRISSVSADGFFNRFIAVVC
ncbi:Pvc16 family protein [Tolypothrix bouteillei VB521301_2]|uniref:Pvc16 family protein n=1 Tax=Tolypothrix bouteillei TaxID=1246981 RepID=UPI0038B6B084